MRRLSHEEISKKRLKLDEIASAQRIPVTVLVDNVRSLYNVGSIFRTSDGAMIRKLILTGLTPQPPRREIEKTALGSTATVPWAHYKDPLEALAIIRQEGMKICCLEHTTTSIPYYAFQPNEVPLCLVIGNEITGISKSIIGSADFAIEIPMFGLKHSLNVAVAYGIAIFELSRTWRTSHRSNQNARV